MSLHLGDDLLLIADIAVRHKANDPQMIAGVARVKRGFDRFHHFGSAAALPRLQKCLRSFEVCFRCWYRTLKQDRCVAGERDQIERIVRIETLKRKPHRFLGLVDRKTVHRTRRIEYKDDLFRSAVLARDLIGRLKYQGKEAAATIAVRQHGVLDLFPRNVVTKNEILIRDRFLPAQRHLCSVRGKVGLVDLVRRRPDLLDGHAGIQINVDRNVAAISCLSDRRFYLRGVFHRPRDISWADSHRKHELV